MTRAYGIGCEVCGDLVESGGLVLETPQAALAATRHHRLATGHAAVVVV